MKGKGREEGKWTAATDPILPSISSRPTASRRRPHRQQPSGRSEARRLEPPRSSDGASAAASQHQTPALSVAQPISIVASLASQPTAAWPLPAAAGQREVQRGGLSRPAHPTEPPSAAASQHQTPAHCRRRSRSRSSHRSPRSRQLRGPCRQQPGREVQRGGLSRPALADSAAASDHQPPVLPTPTVACRSTRSRLLCEHCQQQPGREVHGAA